MLSLADKWNTGSVPFIDLFLNCGEYGVTSRALIRKYEAAQPGTREEAEDRDARLQLVHLEITVEISGMGRVAFKETTSQKANKKLNEGRGARERQRRRDQKCGRKTKLVHSPKNQ